MTDPAQITDAPQVHLPGTPARVAKEQPDLWRAFQELGEATGNAGPLSEREQQGAKTLFASRSDAVKIKSR